MDPLLLSTSATVEAAVTSLGRLWNSPRRQLRHRLTAALGTTPDDIAGAFQSLIAECDLRSLILEKPVFGGAEATTFWACPRLCLPRSPLQLV